MLPAGHHKIEEVFITWHFVPGHVLVLVFALGVYLIAQIVASPPVAKRVEHQEVRHGATVVDDYFWLREKSNPEVIQYLEAENAYTEAMTKDLQPFQEALYQEMLGHIKQTDLSVPQRRGEFFYYSRTEEGKQYPIQCRKKGSLEAKRRGAARPERASPRGSSSWVSAPSRSATTEPAGLHDRLRGFRQFSLHVKDLRTGAELPDTAERVITSSGPRTIARSFSPPKMP